MKMNAPKEIAAVVCFLASLGLNPVSAQDIQPVPEYHPAITQDMPPQGMPPQGQAGKSLSAFTAVRRITGKQVLLANQTLSARKGDENAVLAEQGSAVTLQNVHLTKTGDTTSGDGSNFNGQNAVLLVSNSKASVCDSVIESDAEGANAVFSTGEEADVTVENVRIQTHRNSSRGLDATYGGTIHGNAVTISTAGAHCASLATDRGEGNVYVTDSTLATSGEGSPVIYSTGNIVLKNSTGTAKGSEIACVEGKNSITVENADLTGYAGHGVMLYQSFSGDAGTGTASFTAKDSRLHNYSRGAMFYITNTRATAHVTNTVIDSPKSDTLIEVTSDRWGKAGQNGGDFDFTAENQMLKGNITVNPISAAAIHLTNKSQWQGAIDSSHQAKETTISLDASSTWTVTADSYVTNLTDGDTALRNIQSQGHTVYYDADSARNAWLKGKTHVLPGGGLLKPAS